MWISLQFGNPSSSKLKPSFLCSAAFRPSIHKSIQSSMILPSYFQCVLVSLPSLRVYYVLSIEVDENINFDMIIKRVEMGITSSHSYSTYIYINHHPPWSWMPISRTTLWLWVMTTMDGRPLRQPNKLIWLQSALYMLYVAKVDRPSTPPSLNYYWRHFILLWCWWRRPRVVEYDSGMDSISIPR